VEQVGFKFGRRSTWLKTRLRLRGGVRKGAGRPRKDGRVGPGISHLTRPLLKPRFPVHVTWRIERGVWNLTAPRCGRAVARSLRAGRDKFGFRLIHFAILRDHVHLLVEANDRRALSRGLKGLGIRVAKCINRMMRRHGRVLSDRYHEHILRTVAEVRNVRVYLFENSVRHYGPEGDFDWTTIAPVVRPQTWLLQRHACGP